MAKKVTRAWGVFRAGRLINVILGPGARQRAKAGLRLRLYFDEGYDARPVEIRELPAKKKGRKA